MEDERLQLAFRAWARSGPSAIDTWLHGDHADACVRRATHLYNDEAYRCIDVTTFMAHSIAERGQGVFRNFMREVERQRVPVFIEHVLEPRLMKFFEKRGYHRVGYVLDRDDHLAVPCFIKVEFEE